jgi:hypothetical protein
LHGFAKNLTALELIPRQVDLKPRRKAIPHVRLDAFVIEIDAYRQQLAAQQIVDHE